ncbi:MAG: ECF-type sigma factor [Phycisphaerales bacterium]
MDSQKGAAGTPGDITLLLIAASDGDRQAMDRALPLVYDLLRTQAARLIRRERSGHTLQPTALVHEVWLRLAGQHGARWEDRRHFCAVAATAMRRILVSHARFRRRLKRGGPRAGERVPVETLVSVEGEPSLDLVALDQALERLSSVDSRMARTVELRYFAGLSVEETADVLEVASATVKREWSLARAWLRRELGGAEAAPA